MEGKVTPEDASSFIVSHPEASKSIDAGQTVLAEGIGSTSVAGTVVHAEDAPFSGSGPVVWVDAVPEVDPTFQGSVWDPLVFTQE